ncbi:TPM domain-containing protein, partial [Leptospira barantonii]
MIRRKFGILRFFLLFLVVAGWNLKTVNSSPIFFREEWRSEDPTIPPLRTQITDTTSTLTDLQKSRLTSTLVDLEKRKGSQIAILIVGSTSDWTIEEYAVKVFETWKLGRKDIRDGVLMVVAIQDHKTRIETGYGLEGALPDVICKRIIEDFMIPHFRNGDYYQGITEGIARIIERIDGEELPPASGRVAGSDSESSSSTDGPVIPSNLVTAFIILVVLGKLFGFLFGNGLSGGIGAVLFVILGIFWSITFWLLIPGAFLLWFFVLANGGGMGSSSSWGSSSGGGGGSWSGG